MTRARAAKLLTAAALAASFGLVALRTRRPAMPEGPPAAARAQTPGDAVYAMLEAARAGDVEAYLNTLAGDQADLAARTLRETGLAEFRAALQRSQRGVKGIALRELEDLGGERRRIHAEYVFEGRNEAQQIGLVRRGGGWKIESVAAASPVSPAVPYGAPVR
jgi:hypothetical protein